MPSRVLQYLCNRLNLLEQSRVWLLLLQKMFTMEFLATDPRLPVRIVVRIAFIATICAFVYVSRHLGQIEKAIVSDNLVPSELGARNNMVLMVCLIPIIVTALLRYPDYQT